MLGIAFLLVVASGFLHSVWNLFAKRSLNKKVFLWFCQLFAFFAFLPWMAVEWDGNAMRGPALIALVASMCLHGLYMNLLAATYTVGDLSQVYPIMRGTSPLLVPLIGVTLLGEQLSVTGWAGVVSIVVGMALLSEIKLKRSETTSYKAPLLALAVGICIAGYIVVDKIAVGYVPPVIVSEASCLGGLIGLAWPTLRSGEMRRELNANWKYMLLGGIMLPGGYMLFLYALSLAPVAQLAPMREIGTVFGAIMGVFILREKQGARRILSSLMITAGVIVLGMWG
jgi:drug/metabolite transporter (DMT)-like permease